ncbi:MAG TPA: hypothetical protein PLU44_16795 [Candidatus Krumholzibacteria bacterium]|nr:hypothetical protein [Candidatus Krumholzibacteria bacterium]
MKQDKNVQRSPGLSDAAETPARVAELERLLAQCLVTMDRQEQEITRLSAECARLARDLLREHRAKHSLSTMLSLARGELAGAKMQLLARDARGRFVQVAVP